MSYQELDLEVHSDPACYVTFDLSAAGKAIFAFSAVVFGWSMRNVSTTTEATLDIYDGTDTTGISLFGINLAGNQTGRDWFGDRGILFRNGLYINVTAQEVKGAVFYRPHRH